MTTTTAKEMSLWALANLWQQGKEGGYAVRHGQRPVRDFGRRQQGDQATNETDGDRTNFFEKAFPCLFPYGEGSIESDQQVAVDFSEHVKWAIHYHNRQFHTHETFPFVTFRILQCRQVLLSARLQMQR